MKKLFALLLVAGLFTVTSCKNDKPAEDTGSTSTEQAPTGGTETPPPASADSSIKKADEPAKTDGGGH